MGQTAARPGFWAGGALAAVVLIAVLGVFALPALVGAALVGGLALARGLPSERAVGLGVAVGAVLLIIGALVAYLIVPTARVEFGRSDLLGTDARRVLFSAATPVP